MSRENKLDAILDLLSKQRDALDSLTARFESFEKNAQSRFNALERKNNENHNEILYDLQKINQSTQNMDEHINFVENVYNVVKYPFVNVLRYFDYTDECKEIESINSKRIQYHQI